MAGAPTASVAELLAAPIGRYYAGRTFVAWVVSPAVVGACHFGAFEPADEAAATELADLPLHPALVPPLDLLHDLGGVDVLDRLAFERFVRLLAPRMPAIVKRSRRIAMVRPAGLAGAAFTGLFHEWSVPHVTASLFEDRGEALDWLAVTAEQRAELAEVIAPFEVGPLLRAIRAAIAADLTGATLERVAAAMGHSARSLQRHLADAGATFRDELGRARVVAAKARLADSDDKIETIARELGFGSLAAFTTMFSRATGEPPQQYRKGRRS